MISGDPQRKCFNWKWVCTPLLLIVLTVNWFYLDSTFVENISFAQGWGKQDKHITVICRNKTPLHNGAGIRPFLSGLYYHLGKKFDYLWLSKQF